MTHLKLLGVLVATAACAFAGCATDTPGTRAAPTTVTTPPPATTGPGTIVTRPDGPAAALSGPLSGGRGIALATARPGPDLTAAGYTEQEYSASGTATSYRSDGELPTNGHYRLTPDASAGYTTRIVVRRPTEPSRSNGTVAVEWFNVSGGADAAPDYTYLADELVRRGYSWVGVSAQRIGIEGGAVAVEAPGADVSGAGKGIKALDPERYSALHHPGDAFSYDIYTQVARALRAPVGENPLAGVPVERLLAVGESQSAMTLTTYRNGVQPLTNVFDGFFIHSRGGSAAPLGEPGTGIDIASSITGKPTTIRSDDRVPTILVQTETDVLGILDYYPARQADSDQLRLWEVAGTAHADAFQIGAIEPMLGCAQPINRGQQSFVLRAALRHLDTWVQRRGLPPSGARLHVDTSGSTLVYGLDPLGNVQGGVRTPAVDVPVDVLSGRPGPDSSVICLLMGTTTPIPAERLATLYPSADQYVADYTRAADRAIAEGFVLADDRAALVAEADPSRLSG
jgi:hypothetical protein